MTKHLTKAAQGRKDFFFFLACSLSVQPSWWGKAWWPELTAADHTVTRMSDHITSSLPFTESHVSCFLAFMSPAHEMVLSRFRVDVSVSINQVQKFQRLVSGSRSCQLDRINRRKLSVRLPLIPSLGSQHPCHKH